MTLELALLTLEAGTEQHLLITVVAGCYHVECLCEPMSYVVRHAPAYSGRARRPGRRYRGNRLEIIIYVLMKNKKKCL